jgi:hypothetical protein
MQFLWFFEHLRYNDLIYKLLYWEYGLPSTDIALSIELNFFQIYSGMLWQRSQFLPTMLVICH